MDSINDVISNGLRAAFVDSRVTSSVEYRPQLLTNDYANGKKVLSAIENELLGCDEFAISVAFITMGGISPLLQTLKELERRGVPGRILTTDYLAFSDPKALDKLLSFSNISIRLFCSEEADIGFHTKGYLFKREEVYRIIVGSSNITLDALTSNIEWNTKLVSTEKGEIAEQIVRDFEGWWESPFTYDYVDIRVVYASRYSIRQEQIKAAKASKVVELEQYKLVPNNMQENWKEERLCEFRVSEKAA